MPRDGGVTRGAPLGIDPFVLADVLAVTAWVGVEQVSHPRQPFGSRRVSYRHYLGELP